MAYQKENESDTKAALICHLIEELTLVHFIYADPVEERPAVFDIFDQLECVSQVVPPKISTVLEIVSAFAKFTAGEPEKYDRSQFRFLTWCLMLSRIVIVCEP